MPKLYILNYLKDFPGEKIVYVPAHLIKLRIVYQKDLLTMKKELEHADPGIK
jgi:hypothetical protein